MASPKVIAAGQAAASWARARRAAWTSVPLPRPVAPAPPAPKPAPEPIAYREPEREPVVAPPVREPIPEPPVISVPERAALHTETISGPERAALHAETISGPERAALHDEPIVEPLEPAYVEAIAEPEPARAKAKEKVKKERKPLSPWVWRGAAAAAVVAAIAAGWSYAVRGIKVAGEKVGTLATSATSAVATKPAPPRTSGTLKVSTTPDGAMVLVDGKPRGKTPITVDNLTFGEHKVVIQSEKGTINRTVNVTADAVAQLDEQIFDGWVAVFSPIEVVISEGSRVLRPDNNEIMLTPGPHRLRFVNRSLALDEVRSVEIKPGERTPLTFAPRPSSISVTTADAAEVFLDGTKLGDTPLSGAPATIGTHELVVRRAAGGEKRMTITVTTKPFSTTIDF